MPREESEKPDHISHPPHYTYMDPTYEPIKVILAWALNFPLGNVIKYVARAGRKEGSDTLNCLRKARRYLDIEIERLERQAGPKAGEPVMLSGKAIYGDGFP